ncbi:MAG: ABC transporter permease [Verrucomicrobiota bacterium]
MPEITIFSLFLCLLPMVAVFWIFKTWSGSGREVIHATLRMTIQLVAIGFALVFLFQEDNPLIGLMVIGVMIVASSFIAVRTVRENKRAAITKAMIANAAGSGSVFLFVLFAVLQVRDPWYQPRVLIPIAGMVFSNAMTSITLAVERFERETGTGATYKEARAAAWNAALIPQINALLAVGLVSLPGMMTGQILAGIDPLVAVRYQIVVMAMVLQSSSFSVAIFLTMSCPKPSGKGP